MNNELYSFFLNAPNFSGILKKTFSNFTKPLKHFPTPKKQNHTCQSRNFEFIKIKIKKLYNLLAKTLKHE
jgi:hypothetical protein